MYKSIIKGERQMPKKENIVEKDARILPNNLEAEQAVLYCAISDSEAAINIVAKLVPEDFYSHAHKKIFEAIVALYQRDVHIDFVTLTDQLESTDSLASIGGVEYLTTIQDSKFKIQD